MHARNSDRKRRVEGDKERERKAKANMHTFAPRVRPPQSGNRRIVTLTQHHQTKYRRCLQA